MRTHGLLINSESFLTLHTSASSTAHVHVRLLPSDMEYAILDTDSVRKCKFTVKDNTSHLVYPSFNKELATNDNYNVRSGLVYIHIYVWIYVDITVVIQYINQQMHFIKIQWNINHKIQLLMSVKLAHGLAPGCYPQRFFWNKGIQVQHNNLGTDCPHWNCQNIKIP